jgi:hypothetical protein
LGSIVTIVGTLSWADTTTPPAPPTGAPPPPGAAQPCKEIVQACSNAGFVKGEAAQGKGLFRDCMHPIMHGQAVTGVTVDPAVVSACKQRMAQRRAHHGGQGGGQTGSQGGGQPDGQGGAPAGGQDGGQGGDSNN